MILFLLLLFPFITLQGGQEDLLVGINYRLQHKILVVPQNPYTLVFPVLVRDPEDGSRLLPYELVVPAREYTVKFCVFTNGPITIFNRTIE